MLPMQRGNVQGNRRGSAEQFPCRELKQTEPEHVIGNPAQEHKSSTLCALLQSLSLLAQALSWSCCNLAQVSGVMLIGSGCSFMDRT